MGLRREGRELALQALYAHDYSPDDPRRRALRLFWETTKAPERVRLFAEGLVEGVLDNCPRLDETIAAKSKNWSLSRMARVDVNILRVAVYELLYRPDIPKVVTINEAIEIAKTFGNEDSPAFINGILDEISSELPDK